MKKLLSKVFHDWPIFFQYPQLAQNRPKSHILFHKNGSLGNFYTKILFKTYVTPDDSTTKAPKPKKGAKEMQSM